MIKNTSKVLAHLSATSQGNFVTDDYILHRKDQGIELLNRFCPHRFYPLADLGVTSSDHVCKFHGLSWTQDGTPKNNNKNIKCGSATVGKTGLVFKNFVEPNHQWVNDLANETNLQYSHTCTGSSHSSALWMMEIQTDLLHIRHGGVHPRLSTMVDLSDVQMEQGNDWVVQTHKDGWWLIIYPWTFVEWSPGCLGINTVVTNSDSEFGFRWTTQFYFDPSVSQEKRNEFVTLEDVFKEDVAVIEQQKGPFRPLLTSMERLEDHCVHFGQWVNKNKAL